MRSIKNAKYIKKYKNNVKLSIMLSKIACFMILIIVLCFANFCCESGNFNNKLNRGNSNVAYATPSDNSGDNANLNEEDATQKELENEIDNTLKDIDFGELEEQLAEISTSGNYNLFADLSFGELVKQIIAGEFVADFGSIMSGIWQGVLSGFKQALAPMLIVLVIAVLYILYSSFISSKSEGVLGVVRLICLSAIVIIVLGLSGSVISNCTKSIVKMQKQMDAVFPILLTFMSSMGSVVSVKSYQPTVLFLSGAISNIFTYLLLPIFTCVLVISVANNFSSRRSLSKFQNFFKSFFKWVIGTVFAVYMTILSFQGITAGSSDGISIKATKYAMKNYIPYLGGYVSEGFELVKASSILLKNSVGFSAILLLLATVIAPIMALCVFTLSLKLIAGLIEPLGDSKLSGFIENFANTFKMLSAIIIGVALMYFFTLTIMICTVNVI